MAKKPAKKTTAKKAAPAKKPKGKAAPAAATSANEKRFNSPVNEEDRALFLQTLPKIADLKAKVASATANLRNAYKTAKKDGFTKADFEVAFAIQGAEGEKKKKAAIARDLTIAKWLGCDLGMQLDLFVEDERVPAEDRAYEEGKTASMTGQPCKPDYDPSVPQYASYIKGFQDHQQTLHKQFKKKEDHPEVKADQEADAAKRATIDNQKAADAQAFEQPKSGVPMTRAEFKRLQAEQQAAAVENSHAEGQADIEETTIEERDPAESPFRKRAN
jgi:hypothetical protein